MKWMPGVRPFRVGDGQRKLAESAELALLLVKISSSADGGNTGSRLLGELISIVRRPGTARHTGNVELGLLRQSPGDQKIAQAAAEVIVERAHADSAFGAALDAWRRKDEVREYLGSPVGGTDPGQGRRKWIHPDDAARKRTPERPNSSEDQVRGGRSTQGSWWRKPVVWVTGIVASAIAAVLAGWLSAGVHDLGTLNRSSQVPFTWTIARTGNVLNRCQGWLFPQPISRIPVRAFRDINADEQWALRNHGTDIMEGAWTITFQGLTSESVAIQDVRVRVVAKKPVPNGTDVYSLTGCGGTITVRYFDVAIDSTNLHIMPEEGAKSWPYSISGSDIEELSLKAYIDNETQYEYSFYYEVRWAQGADTGTVDIGLPDGRPFTLVPEIPGGRFYYSYNGKWNVGGE